MNDTETAVDAGWFQDAVRPWIAHRWDGQRWTGEVHRRGRVVLSEDPPTSPPQPSRRVEPDDLSSGSPGVSVPVGVLPLVTGVVVVLTLLPSLYSGVESVILGASLSVALPLPLVILLVAALGLALYGIVALAVARVGTAPTR